MLKIRHSWKMFVFLGISALFLGLFASGVRGHCDTESGPVAVAASKALETGHFGSIAIWVGERQEKELRAGFEDALAVYQMGGKAKDLAERYFMETAVRLHREAEGMPYTGLKPAQPLPSDIAEAEKALETGNIDPLIELLSAELQKEIQTLFQKAREAKNTYDGENVELGREWVDSYVRYVIYVHGIFQTIHSGPEHGIGHAD